MIVYFKKTRKVALAVTLAASMLLVGCGDKARQSADVEVSHEIVGTLTDVEVIEKKFVDGGKWGEDEYVVTVSKNNDEITLKAFSSYSFKAIHVGEILDIGYTEDNFIKEIRLIEREENSNE